MVKGVARKGQVTIFVIIALIILVFGIGIYFFYPEVVTTASSLEENPQTYLQNCIQDTFEENVNTISLQGGSMEPIPSRRYQGNDVEYLCYTINPLQRCIPQRVFLVNHIEKEIKNSIKKKVDSCLESLKEDYSNKNYAVELEKGKIKVSLLPKRIRLEINSSFSLSKDSSKIYNSFIVSLNNNLYELASIAETIGEFEKQVNDMNPDLIRFYYSDLRISKHRLTDGTKIYLLEDKTDGSKFQFAFRGGVTSPGIFIPNSGGDQ